MKITKVTVYISKPFDDIITGGDTLFVVESDTKEMYILFNPCYSTLENLRIICNGIIYSEQNLCYYRQEDGSLDESIGDDYNLQYHIDHPEALITIMEYDAMIGDIIIHWKDIPERTEFKHGGSCSHDPFELDWINPDE